MREKRFWRPAVDASRFSKAGLSDGVFDEFFHLVHLCHCVRHWASEKQDAKRMAKHHKGMGWEASGRTAETHEMRSRFLAAERVWLLERAAACDADHRLVVQIMHKSGLEKKMRSHEQANFAAIALSEFDGAI